MRCNQFYRVPTRHPPTRALGIGMAKIQGCLQAARMWILPEEHLVLSPFTKKEAVVYRV